MATIQFLPETEIKALMVQHGAIARIKASQLSRKEKDRGPAKSWPGGDSVMCNYYDETGEYVATVHKVISEAGETVHCDVKRFVVGDNDYRIPRKASAIQTLEESTAAGRGVAAGL